MKHIIFFTYIFSVILQFLIGLPLLLIGVDIKAALLLSGVILCLPPILQATVNRTTKTSFDNYAILVMLSLCISTFLQLNHLPFNKTLMFASAVLLVTAIIRNYKLLGNKYYQVLIVSYALLVGVHFYRQMAWYFYLEVYYWLK